MLTHTLSGVSLSMSTKQNHSQSVHYLLITIATFLVLQSCVVVLHEFTHSTTAWLLGEMKSPLDIVWGNPITMTGWDEGVEYRRMFATGDNWQAAIIGFCPIIMHTLAISICILLMRGNWLVERKWLFHTVYWYCIVNFMELIAYVYMRAFSGHGDIGNFDRGVGISPWWIFVLGSLVLTWGLWLYFQYCLPRLQRLFARNNRELEWVILILSSFILFLWGSGIRVMAYVSGPQWLFGLMGVPAFLFTIYLFRPRSS